MKLTEFLSATGNFLLQMDFFGQMPTFRILGKQKYNTTIGLIMTLVTITITILYFIAGLQEMISKQTPTIIQTDRQVIETSVRIFILEAFQLLPSNFTLAISVADQDQQPLQTINKYFTISIQNCHFYRQKNITSGIVTLQQKCQQYPTEPCGQQHFITQVQKDYFANIRLGAVQCIQKDLWDSTPPIIQGVKSGVNYSQLTITFAACFNTSEKTDCASSEQISAQLQSGYYVVHISDSLLQFMKSGNMSGDIIQLQYSSFSSSTSKSIYQGFKIIQTQTDDGIMFADISKTEHLIQNTYRESTDLYNSQFLVQHNIILDNKYSSYERSYIRIWTILSRVGGLYQIILILIAALIKPLIQTLMQIAMSNEIFRFQGNTNSHEKDQYHLEAIDAMSGIVRSSRFQQRNNLQSCDSGKLLKKLWEKRHRKLGSSCRSVISILCGFDKISRKQLLQADTLFMQRIDIANIIQKLHEIDKLKFIILSDDQRNLFDCLPKPLIKSSESDFDYTVLKYSYVQKNLYNDSHSSFLSAAFESFQNLITQNKLTTIDKAILNCLDDDIKLIFQQVHLDITQRLEKRDCSADFQFPHSKSQFNIIDYSIDGEEEQVSKEGTPQVASVKREIKRILKS